jgi:hypothetical protein
MENYKKDNKKRRGRGGGINRNEPKKRGRPWEDVCAVM